MSRFFPGSSDYSYSSSNEENNSSCIERFKQKFIETDFFSLVTDEQWGYLETKFKQYIDNLVWGAASVDDQAALVEKINEISGPIEDPFDQSRFLLLIKQFLFFVAEEHAELSNEQEKALLDFLEKVAPVTLVHNSMDVLGTVQVKHDDNIVGYFKPGVYRQESDMFLFRFYQFLKDHMELPGDLESVFVKTHPCQINLSEVSVPVGGVIHEGAEISVDFRSKDQSYKKNIFLHENSDGLFHGLNGGLQRALPAWRADGSPLELLIMLSMVLLISGRDIKEDGIFGNTSGTLVDTECYLEKQYAKGTRELLPDIHIPYHAKFSKQMGWGEDWEQLQTYLLKLSAEDVKAFVESQKVSFEESMPGNLSVDNEHTTCSIEPDDRSEYVVETPTYEENRFLSQEQIAYLSDNILRLQAAVQEVCEKGDAAPIYSLVKAFDPLWAKEAYNFHMFTAATGSSIDNLGEPLPPEVQEELRAIYSEASMEAERSFSQCNPHDHAGWIQLSPVPEGAPTEDTRRWLDSSSPVGSLDSTSTESASAHRDPVIPAMFAVGDNEGVQDFSAATVIVVESSAPMR